MPSITLAVTGQALLHGPVDAQAAGAVADLLRGSDAAFANLEATVETPGAWPTKTKTLHLTSPAGIASLAEIGFSGLTHANNHAFDLGPPGIVRTREVVETHGLRLAGSGNTAEQAAAAMRLGRSGAKVAVVSVDLGPQPDIVYAGQDRAGINPLRLHRHATVPDPDLAALRRILQELGDDKRDAARAAVGYQASTELDNGITLFGTRVQRGPITASAFVPDAADLASFRNHLAEARGDADVVAVAVHGHHWDPDWTRAPDWMLALCRNIIDAGADLVVGTGAPVLQPIALHQGKPILAGMGNFLFHTRRSVTYDREGVPVWTGAAFRCRFDLAQRRCSGIEIMPIAVGRPAEREGDVAPAPRPLAGEEAGQVFSFLTQNLSDEERACVTRV